MSQYKTEQRSQPYHTKYEYRVKFMLQGASYTYWNRTYYEYQLNIQERKNSWGNHRDLNYDPDLMTKYFAFKSKHLDKKSRSGSKFKDITITVTHGHVTVFTNDVKVCEHLVKTFGAQVTQAVISIPRGVMYFKKDPPAARRVYLKSKRVEDEFRDELKQFFSSNQDIKPSNGLRSWLNHRTGSWHTKYTSASHYIEFEDDGFHTILLLFLGNKYLGKYYELHKEPA